MLEIVATAVGEGLVVTVADNGPKGFRLITQVSAAPGMD